MDDKNVGVQDHQNYPLISEALVAHMLSGCEVGGVSLNDPVRRQLVFGFSAHAISSIKVVRRKIPAAPTHRDGPSRK